MYRINRGTVICMFGLWILCSLVTAGSASEQAKTELLIYLMIEARQINTNYQCELRLAMDLEKLAGLMEQEEQERLMKHIKETSAEMHMDMMIRYRAPQLFAQYSGTMLNNRMKGTSLADDEQLKQIVEMPKGTMGFRMDYGDVDIQSIMMMMNNSQPGMKYGSGFSTYEMLGPRAIKAVLEHLLKYYTSRILETERLEGQEMLVIEFLRKDALLNEHFRNVDLPLYPKFTLWVSKDNLFVYKMQIFDEKNNPMITTRMKNYEFNKDFSDSIFNVEFPEDLNVVDMTPLLNILATMKEKQMQGSSSDQEEFERIINKYREKPGVRLDWDLPPMQVKPINSSDKFSSWKPVSERPVLVVLWSTEFYGTPLFVPDLVILQKLADDQKFAFINIVRESDAQNVKELLSQMMVPLTVYQIDEDGWNSFKPSVLPAFYLFDKIHRLQWRDGGIIAWTDCFNLNVFKYLGIDLRKGFEQNALFKNTIRKQVIDRYFPFLTLSKSSE